MQYITPDSQIKRRLGENPFPSWDAAVISFRSQAASKDLLRMLDAKPIETKLLYGIDNAPDTPFAYTASIGNKTVGIVTHCVWGGPQAAILVEEIACLGCKHIIGYSCAGAIDLSLNIGQQIVADRAVPTDGTSLAYGHTELIADVGLLELTKDVAQRLGHDIAPVCAATVDAIYRETPELAAYLRSKGGQVINLEISPFYAASKACGVSSILLGHVSDRLADTWETWHFDRKPISIITAEICVEMLRSLLVVTGE